MISVNVFGEPSQTKALVAYGESACGLNLLRTAKFLFVFDISNSNSINIKKLTHFV